MTQLETLSGTQGRTLLREIYRELRFERQLGAVATLRTCWSICTTERELFRLTKRDVVVLHPLGVWAGTSLWMQEIVNRHFYAPVNAVVYLGAAGLLLAVGLNRTHVIDTPALVVAGIVVEALLLATLFTVMFFAPPDETDTPASLSMAGGSGTTEELLRELGEIGRDYAAMAVQLESIAGTLSDIVERQDSMLSAVTDSVQAAVSAVAPNPELLASMRDTTSALNAFAGSVGILAERLRAVERQEVERLVRTELERMLSTTILHRDERPVSTPTQG
jgi:hypothetical protein